MATFTRTTITNLRSEIVEVNAALETSGSGYRYREQGRNGYHAVDLMRIEEDGELYCVGCMDCGETPRKLITRLNDEYEFYLGKAYPAT